MDQVQRSRTGKADASGFLAETFDRLADRFDRRPRILCIGRKLDTLFDLVGLIDERHACVGSPDVDRNRIVHDHFLLQVWLLY